MKNVRCNVSFLNPYFSTEKSPPPQETFIFCKSIIIFSPGASVGPFISSLSLRKDKEGKKKGESRNWQLTRMKLLSWRLTAQSWTSAKMLVRTREDRRKERGRGKNLKAFSSD